MGGFLSQFISNAGDFVWGAPMIAMLVSTGSYISIRTGFFQLTHLGRSLKAAFGADSKKRSDSGTSPFQSACTALSATMGTGNIAGVAGAVALGGPGAIFWMWVSAFFGMAVKLAEIILAVRFREYKNGEYCGGPMYYIKNGLPKAFFPLSIIFSACGIAAMLGTGSTAQINTMAVSVCALFPMGMLSACSQKLLCLAVGLICAATAAAVLSGGARRIGSFTERLVPFMTLLFFAMAAGVLLINIKSIPAVFASIIKGAFDPAAVTGGAVGSAVSALKKGVSRGIFSNEAGMGTAPMAYACSSENNAVKQGMLGIFEVFADTVVMCTVTALVILCAVPVSYGSDPGASLTLAAFVSVYGRWISLLFCAVVCFFAFSSVVGWGLYGLRCAEFLFGSRSKKLFIILFFVCCTLGAVIPTDTVWKISELLNGIMALPNLIAVLLLSETVFGEIKNYKEL